jgi:hypothetical protein
VWSNADAFNLGVPGTAPAHRRRDFAMIDAITPADRVTAVFDPESDSELHCSYCGAAVTDDDPECPTCDSPIDWGSSAAALRTWQLRERID